MKGAIRIEHVLQMCAQLLPFPLSLNTVASLSIRTINFQRHNLKHCTSVLLKEKREPAALSVLFSIETQAIP